MPAAGRYTWYTAKGCAQRTGDFKITKVAKDHVNCVGGGRTDSNVVQPMVALEVEELMFWYSLVGADRPPKEAMLVAIACLEQEYLGFGALSWERKVIRAEKIADGRVSLPARSGYISENRGTVLGKSRRGRVYPAVFSTRQGESGRRPISCVRFTLEISSYPAVSRFDQGIPCCDVYPLIIAYLGQAIGIFGIKNRLEPY